MAGVDVLNYSGTKWCWQNVKLLGPCSTQTIYSLLLLRVFCNLSSKGNKYMHAFNLINTFVKLTYIYCGRFPHHHLLNLHEAEQRSAVTNKTGWPKDTAALIDLNQMCCKENNSMLGCFSSERCCLPSCRCWCYPELTAVSIGEHTTLITTQLSTLPHPHLVIHQAMTEMLSKWLIHSLTLFTFKRKRLQIIYANRQFFFSQRYKKSKNGSAIVIWYM